LLAPIINMSRSRYWGTKFRKFWRGPFPNRSNRNESCYWNSTRWSCWYVYQALCWQ
jgi:hypothetical protein